MKKIVKSGLRDCTVTLDGTECSVKFDSCYRAFSVRNDGTADVYISKYAGIVPDADGVMCVKSGGSAVFAHMDIYADTIYLLGTGKVQIHAQNDTNNPFKSAPVVEGGGGKTEYAEGIIKEYNDFNSPKWVEITQHNDNSFVMADENTIDCCFMYSSLGSENVGRIFETKDSAGYLRYTLDIDNGFLDFYLNKENWYSPTESGDYHIDTYEIIPNILYNITAIFKNASTDIYINGVLFVSIPETIAVDTRIKDLCLKASFKLSNRGMEGHVFSLRMYNRALSESEILNNWEVDVERYGIDEIKTY